MPAPTISDVCLVTRDIEAAVAFYTGKLDFELAHRMPNFADFKGPGVTLALWTADEIREATGVPAQASRPDGSGVMVAVQLDTLDAIDEMYSRLAERGIECYAPPKDYPWNARAIYFGGPCGEFWEFYAWHEGGEPGNVG